MQINTDPAFEIRFQHYPTEVKEKLDTLRDLVHKTAEATPEVNQLHETLKWNEPSFVTKVGSTLRMDWKAKNPDQYALYFQCSSRLVETFRLLFPERLEFEGKRAVVLSFDEELPTEELTYCIQAALRYHKVKHLPTLGI
ncbi:MAG: DUF1801 domain-containing protein [Bacteroidota bacterium]